MSLLGRWFRLWERRETGEALALVRILVAAVILYDLLEVARLGLVCPLWAPIEEGGIGPARHAEPVALFYEWFGASARSAWLLFSLACAAASALALGLFSRFSALALWFAWVQLAQLSPDADRGIDTLLRNVLVVLACAPAGATLSLDARRREGRFVSEREVSAWPRYLIVAQLVLLYFSAGMLKQSAAWSAHGGYGALAQVLHKPHYTRFEVPHAWIAALYPLVQAGTFTTVIWERSALLLPLLLWLRATQARGGQLRRWVNRLRVLELWVATGMFFHLALAAVLALGIFPWGCLALYPALAEPRTLRAWAARVREYARARFAGAFVDAASSAAREPARSRDGLDQKLRSGERPCAR